MRLFSKVGLTALALTLAGAAAAPVRAQSRVFSEVLQFSTTGAYLGIEMDDVTSSNMGQYKLSSERGVIVRSVMQGSPAAAANLQENDVILDYGGTPVWSSAHLKRLVQETPPGRNVELKVSRDGKLITLTARIRTRDGAGQGRGRQWDGSPLDEFFSFRDLSPRSRRSAEPAGRPRLGVTLQPLTEQLGEFLGVPGKQGALVASVADGSPATGKLKPGDVVISADGREIREPEDLIQAVQNKQGDMTLKVIRDKRETSVVVTLPRLSEPSSGRDDGIKL